jgi:hypothetical protein
MGTYLVLQVGIWIECRQCSMHVAWGLQVALKVQLCRAPRITCAYRLASCREWCLHALVHHAPQRMILTSLSVAAMKAAAWVQLC